MLGQCGSLGAVKQNGSRGLREPLSYYFQQELTCNLRQKLYHANKSESIISFIFIVGRLCRLPQPLIFGAHAGVEFIGKIEGQVEQSD